ncbi:MAG: hypothetical protein U9N45_08495, partial [Gemmatimonadota bacterium]|nr:hypothetical protein [Gemmatimonadota bacterium]
KRAYLIARGGDPSRTRKLLGILLDQGIEVRRATRGFECRSLTGSDNRKVSRLGFKRGTYVIPAGQESHALVINLLDPRIEIEEAYLAEQERRLAAGLDSQIYDITAWSLPALFGVPCYRTENLTLSTADCPTVDSIELPRVLENRSAKLAYILDGGGNSSMAALAGLLRREVRVYSSDKAFTLDEKKFPRGSLIVPVKENPEKLPEIIAEIEKEHRVGFYPTGSSWVEEGVSFGSIYVHYLPRPRVLLAWDHGTHAYSAGWARYILEQQYGVPLTTVTVSNLGRIKLERYNVLILPNGWYGGLVNKACVERIKQWVRRGGTLVGIHGAAGWLADPEVGLLEAGIEYRLDEDTLSKKKPGKGEEKTNRVPGTEIKDLAGFSRVITAEKTSPRSLPGVLARIRLDPDHWLSAGYDSTAVAFMQGRQVFSPLKRSQGRNVAFFDSAENLLISGYSWKGPSLRQLAFKPYLMYRPLGQGHVIAFTEDPNFRAFCDGLNRLVMNAVLLGPGH